MKRKPFPPLRLANREQFLISIRKYEDELERIEFWEILLFVVTHLPRRQIEFYWFEELLSDMLRRYQVEAYKKSTSYFPLQVLSCMFFFVDQAIDWSHQGNATLVKQELQSHIVSEYRFRLDPDYEHGLIRPFPLNQGS